VRPRAVTVRIARWSATHPWRAMALWVVFVAACITIGNVAGTKQATNNGNVGETARAEQLIKDGKFPTDPATERVLISARSGPLDRAAAQAVATDAAARMRTTAGVTRVAGPIPSPDGTTLMLSVSMSGDPKTATDRVQPLLDTTSAVQRDHPGLRVEEVGMASVDKSLDDTIGKDFQRAELFSLPLTLAILLVAFGALIAAGVPLLLALSAVASAIGLSALASHLVPANGSISSVILLIGMAVGVDYSLFYLRREREERAKGAGHLDAVGIAAATPGRAIVVSGVAVVISMAGMFLAGDDIFTSFAIGSILVVTVSVLGSLTVLPALLAKLGRWVDRPRIPFLWRLTAARQGADTRPRFWSAVLRPALRYPAVTLVLSVSALVALAVPAFGMALKLPGIADVPRTTPVMQAYDRMTAAFPSTGAQHVVVVEAPADEQGQVKAALGTLAARTGADPLFAHDRDPELTVSADGTVTMLTIGTPYRSGTPDGQRSLDRLRTDLVPATVGQVPGARYGVTGEIAGTGDYARHVRQSLPIVVGFVLLLTFLVMAWTFRSVVVALTAIALNMLSVGAAYGLLTLVFQHTWAEKLLDFRSNGGVTAWLPLFLFVVLFGLSMDYHVFVVSRIREARLAGASTREAVAQGITRSAGVVTSAAVVMVGVFAIFGTLSTLDMKQLGVGLASAILIDATIIRAVVLPALMTLLGEANWWAPRFLRPRVPVPAGAVEPEPELVGVR
jgi:putative drug exporter of the RND superfamily